MLLYLRLTHRADATAGVNRLDSRLRPFALREGRRMGIKPILTVLTVGATRRLRYLRCPHLCDGGGPAWENHRHDGGAAEYDW